jgi:hypothetical protein
MCSPLALVALSTIERLANKVDSFFAELKLIREASTALTGLMPPHRSFQPCGVAGVHRTISLPELAQGSANEAFADYGSSSVL